MREADSFFRKFGIYNSKVILDLPMPLCCAQRLAKVVILASCTMDPVDIAVKIYYKWGGNRVMKETALSHGCYIYGKFNDC